MMMIQNEEHRNIEQRNSENMKKVVRKMQSAVWRTTKKM